MHIRSPILNVKHHVHIKISMGKDCLKKHSSFPYYGNSPCKILLGYMRIKCNKKLTNFYSKKKYFDKNSL